MASLDELETALRNADAAGDTEAAQMLADEIVRMRPASPVKPAPAADLTSPSYLMDEAGKYLDKTKRQLLGDGRPFDQQMADYAAKPGDDERMAEISRQAIEKGAAAIAPMSWLASAGGRLAAGAAAGAAGKEGWEDKAWGAAGGAATAGMFETIPALQAIGTMGKRALYDPTWNPERVVGATMRRLAEDPTNPQVLDATIAALKSSQPLVRGSNPTAPQASGNAGLWGLYKTTMAREPAADRAIQDAQNIARLKAFKELGAGENAGRQAEQLQDDALGRLGDATRAADESNMFVHLGDVERRIDELLASPSAIDPVIKSKLQQIKNGLYDVNGNIRETFQEAHALKSKGVNRMMYGNNGLRIAGPSGQELEGLAGSISGQIDDAINASLASPLHNVPDDVRGAYDEFRQGFAKGKTVEARNQALADLLRKGSSPGMLPEIGEVAPGVFGPTGGMKEGEILSTKLLNATKAKQWQKQQDVLTPKQLARIDAIKEDLARNIPRDVKRGSDTYQNMAIDYLTSDILGAHGAGNTLFGGLSKGATWLAGKGLGITKADKILPSANALENPKLRELMVKALTDPQLAAQLIEAAKPASLLYTTIPARVGPSLIEQMGGQ